MKTTMTIAMIVAGGMATACTTMPRDQDAEPGQHNPKGKPCGNATISIHIPATPPGPLTISYEDETVPNAPPGRREVREGCAPRFATVGGAGGDRVLIVFEGETPFKDAAGHPVYVLQADRPSSNSVRARDYSEGVCRRVGGQPSDMDGCKYTAVHFRSNAPSRYMPLDPRIIIVQ